jgi:hypothetical protein
MFVMFTQMNGGVSLTITPLLSLGAYSDENISLKVKQIAPLILSVHLDEIQSLADQQELAKKLKLLTVNSSHTMVWLYSSPQAI